MSHISTILVDLWDFPLWASAGECHREYIGNQRVQTPPRESGEFSIPLVLGWLCLYWTLKTGNWTLSENTASRMQMELQGCNPRGRGFESHRLHSLKQAKTRFSTGAVAQSGRARNVSSTLVVIGFSVAISLRRDEPCRMHAVLPKPTGIFAKHGWGGLEDPPQFLDSRAHSKARLGGARRLLRIQTMDRDHRRSELFGKIQDLLYGPTAQII